MEEFEVESSLAQSRHTCMYLCDLIKHLNYLLHAIYFLVQCNSKLRNRTVVPTSKESNQVPVTDNLMKLILNSFPGGSGNKNLYCHKYNTVYFYLIVNILTFYLIRFFSTQLYHQIIKIHNFDYF